MGRLRRGRGRGQSVRDQAGEDRLARSRGVFDRATQQGFVGADAVLLAAMAADAPETPSARLPRLSWGESPDFAPVAAQQRGREPMGLYALVDSAERLEAVLATGVRTVQLRIKAPSGAGAEWQQGLRPS